MKIHFTASIHGQQQYRPNYETIIKTVEKLGHQLLSKNVLLRDTQDILEETAEQANLYYQKMVKWVRTADIVITEVSHPSIGIGYEISLALNFGKPVIILYTSKNAPYLLEGTQLDKLQLIEYRLEELPKVLEQAIKDAKDQMDVRFNFFISPRIGAYLDWITKHKKLPRAVFLRSLIEEHMKKNKEYRN